MSKNSTYNDKINVILDQTKFRNIEKNMLMKSA